jgi:hypothetical protein
MVALSGRNLQARASPDGEQSRGKKLVHNLGGR